jgi:hypothetical protein
LKGKGDKKVALTYLIRKAVFLVFLAGNLLAFAVGDGVAQIPSFTPATNVLAGNVPYSVAAGDFNKDGITDLVVVNQGSNSV